MSLWQRRFPLDLLNSVFAFLDGRDVLRLTTVVCRSFVCSWDRWAEEYHRFHYATTEFDGGEEFWVFLVFLSHHLRHVGLNEALLARAIHVRVVQYSQIIENTRVKIYEPHALRWVPAAIACRATGGWIHAAGDRGLHDVIRALSIHVQYRDVVSTIIQALVRGDLSTCDVLWGCTTPTQLRCQMGLWRLAYTSLIVERCRDIPRLRVSLSWLVGRRIEAEVIETGSTPEAMQVLTQIAGPHMKLCRACNKLQIIFSGAACIRGYACYKESMRYV